MLTDIQRQSSSTKPIIVTGGAEALANFAEIAKTKTKNLQKSDVFERRLNETIDKKSAEVEIKILTENLNYPSTTPVEKIILKKRLEKALERSININNYYANKL